MLIEGGDITYRIWWRHLNWVGIHPRHTAKPGPAPIRTTICFVRTDLGLDEDNEGCKGQVVFASFAKVGKEDGRKQSLKDLLHHLGWNKALRTRVWKAYFDRKGD